MVAGVQHMNRYVKIIVVLSIVFAIIAAIIFGLYWNITKVNIIPSPTGEYSIKMYWTDVGAWGWRGKVYLIKHDFIDRRYWIGIHVPASIKWVSDYEFEIDRGNKKVCSVYDFIPK